MPPAWLLTLPSSMACGCQPVASLYSWCDTSSLSKTQGGDTVCFSCLFPVPSTWAHSCSAGHLTLSLCSTLASFPSHGYGLPLDLRLGGRQYSFPVLFPNTHHPCEHCLRVTDHNQLVIGWWGDRLSPTRSAAEGRFSSLLTARLPIPGTVPSTQQVM